MVKAGQRYWQSLNPRERRVLTWGGLFAVIFIGYFWIIEPLQQETQRLNHIADKQSQQLAEMQTMAEQLLATTETTSAETLLKPYLAMQQTLPSGEKLSRTGSVPTEQAMTWLPQLAEQGKVRYTTSKNGVNIEFWGK